MATCYSECDKASTGNFISGEVNIYFYGIVINQECVLLNFKFFKELCLLEDKQKVQLWGCDDSEMYRVLVVV